MTSASDDATGTVTRMVQVRTPGLLLTEREFVVPLDHSQPDGEKITAFAREVADPDGRDRPYLVFFDGGPGHEAHRPTGIPSNPAWLARALQDYRVLLLDQRGTGRSTPVGRLVGLNPDEQASYLTHFRADSIVADAELIRKALQIESWSVLGQSFGGFCVVHYLSSAPEGLSEAFVTGGAPAHRTLPGRCLPCYLCSDVAAESQILRAVSGRRYPSARALRATGHARSSAPQWRSSDSTPLPPAGTGARHERRSG